MKLFDRRFVGLAAVAVAVMTYSGCGGSSSSSGDGGGPTVPAPPPEPTPEPTPEPDPPLSESCARLPLGDPTAACQQEVATFQDDVDGAIFTLQGEQPQLFDADGVVQSVGAYYVGLIRILDRKNLCAYFDGEELGVTNSAAFNDQYDILTSKNQIRTGSRTYRSTCYPSAVPAPEPPLGPSPEGCSLPPSRDIACSREPEGKFLFQVEAAIDQVLETRPELFDPNDWAPGTNWIRVKDLTAYQNAVVAVLTEQGFCAKNDRNEEIGVKNENVRSEQYDIQYRDEYIRRGGGIYRSTCYPAAF